MLQNSTNFSCVGLIIASNPRSFQNSWTFETGLSDFFKMTLTVLIWSFAKQEAKVLKYCNYKLFNKTLFKDQVPNKLRSSNLSDKGFKY